MIGFVTRRRLTPAPTFCLVLAGQSGAAGRTFFGTIIPTGKALIIVVVVLRKRKIRTVGKPNQSVVSTIQASFATVITGRVSDACLVVNRTATSNFGVSTFDIGK